jgi:hypothetical protein
MQSYTISSVFKSYEYAKYTLPPSQTSTNEFLLLQLSQVASGMRLKSQMQQPVQEENPNQANTAWTSLNFEVQSI